MNIIKRYLVSHFERQKEDLMAVAGLVAVTFAFFFNTIVLALPISRVCRLAERDSLFSAYWSGVNSFYDVSIYQSLVPWYFLVTRIWHSGHIPLWNPFAGCGSPLMADISTGVFALHRLVLFPYSSLYIYNLSIVLSAAIAVTGTFVLAKSLGLGRWASVSAGLMYAYCPYILFSAEYLVFSSCLFPWLTWLFVRLAKAVTLTRLFAAGAGCAFLIVSTHPELSFFCICFATLLMVLIIISTEPGKVMSSVARAFFATAITGCIAFLLAAPVLLTFAEYMANSDCYKSANPHLRYIVPWQAVAYNMIQPGFGGGSPYLGVIAAMLLPLSVACSLKRGRVMQCVLLVDVVAFAVVTRLGFVDAIFSNKYLAWLVTEYSLPVFLLFMAILSAVTLEVVLCRMTLGFNWLSWAFWLGVAMVVLIPLLLHTANLSLSPMYIDDALKNMSISWRSWMRDLAIVASAVAVLATKKYWCPTRTTIAWVVLIVLSFTSETLIAKNSLPIEPKLKYASIDPVPFLQGQGERIVTMGRHTFCPNTNFVYGISNIVTPNVLYPARFLRFMSEAGITIEGVSQFFDGRLSPVIDLASVRYVVSQMPVVATDDEFANSAVVPGALANGAPNASGVRLRGSQVSYYPGNADALGHLELDVGNTAVNYLSYMPLVLNEDNNVIWFGDRIPFASMTKIGLLNERIIVKGLLAAIIPTRLPTGSDVKVGIQIFDSRTPFKACTPVMVLRAFKVDAQDSGDQGGGGRAVKRHFRLISETGRNAIRVYENTKAMPQAYIVHDVQVAATVDDALRLIISPNFDAVHTVVLEEAGAGLDGKGRLTGNIEGESVHVGRPNPNVVVLTSKLKQPGFVVLTDTYYPGWRAYIDGQSVPISRANYLFRVVRVPTGVHEITMRYEPMSFYLGIAFAGSCLVCFVGAFVWQAVTRHRVQGDPGINA